MTDAEFVAALAAETKAIVASERAANAEVVGALRAEIAQLKEVILSIPAGKDGKDAAEVDVEAIAKRAAEMIPTPKDGADAPPVDVLALSRDVLALIPVPKDGKDGKDGIASRDELRAEVEKAVAESVEPEVERRVEERFRSLPVLMYRGVWRDGEEYPVGSVVTWAGSTWHANAVTKDRPGEGQTDWQLMVKKGRDGKDRT